jgi:hypothetical protein
VNSGRRSSRAVGGRSSHIRESQRVASLELEIRTPRLGTGVDRTVASKSVVSADIVRGVLGRAGTVSPFGKSKWRGSGEAGSGGKESDDGRMHLGSVVVD